MKPIQYLFVVIIIVLLCGSMSYAQWITPTEFMGQYTTNFLNNYPQPATRRSVIGHRCNAITNISGSNNTEETLGASRNGSYIAPKQSILAYLICVNFMDSKDLKKFDQRIAGLVKSSNILTLVPWIDTKTCPINKQSNDLGECKTLPKVVHYLTLKLLDNISNTRKSIIRGNNNISPNERSVALSTIFTTAQGENLSKAISKANLTLCNTPQISFIGNQINSICGYPITNNLYIQNSITYGEPLAEQNTIINTKTILTQGCTTTSGKDLIQCGLNSISSNIDYIALIQNETTIYQLFNTMYGEAAKTTQSFLIGDKSSQGASPKEVLAFLTQELQQQKQSIKNLSEREANITSQFKGKYDQYIAFSIIKERTEKVVSERISSLSNVLISTMRRLLNTQSES